MSEVAVAGGKLAEGVFSLGGNSRGVVSDTITIGTGAAHSAGDVVSTDLGEILEFDLSNMLVPGGSGKVLSSIVSINQNAVFADGAGYTLYLYDAAPTVQATDEAFNMTAADFAKYIGEITIGTLVDKGDTVLKLDLAHNLDFSLAEDSSKIYGKLVCLGGETTITGKIIKIQLGVQSL